MAVASPHEQRRVAARLRAEGATWTEIAEALRARYDLGGIAAARQAHGWSQQQAADQWRARWPHDPTSQGALSGWECWPTGGRMPSLRTLERLAELYEVAASDLLAGWADHRGLCVPSRYGGSVDRRQFNAGAIAAGLALSLPAPGARVGAADLDRLRAEVTRLWHLDEAEGGATVYRTVTARLADVRALLDRSSFGTSTGRQLQVIAGQLQELAGFTAYDAGQHDTARRHFHEALTTARVAEDDELTVYVFAQLANQAAYLHRGAEAVELAQAGQRCARGFAPPRLVALLSTWEAEGHGLRGDTTAAHSALARAESEMVDAGPDTGAWYAYFTPEMLNVGAARTFLSLDAPIAAERCARDAVAPTLARRPRARNAVTHARTLVAAGRLDQAAHVALDAVEVGRDVSSARMRTELSALRPALEDHQSVPGVAEALEALN